MQRLVRLFMIFPFVVLSCNPDEHSTDPLDEEGEPAVTEIGVPNGDTASKEIGPNGGSMTSTDGVLDILIPPGAVTGNTTFSIQPLTNFCPGGWNAYRLLPEGLTFNIPVIITFHLTEEEVADVPTDLLGIAYQGSDQVWYSMPATFEATTRTIVTYAKHFSGWTNLSQLTIAPRVPAIPSLEINQSLNLILNGAGFIHPAAGVESPDPSGDALPRLPQAVPFRARWFVNGVENGNASVGTISVSGDQVNVTYHAPARAPANNPVTISAELSDFRAWDRSSGRRRTYNRVILFKRVKIIEEYNFTLKWEDHNHRSGCNPKQDYYDVAEMDVRVANGIVTISNIRNEAATVTPGTIQLGNTADCTFTCTPGVGYINIQSAEGEVLKESSKSLLYIRLFNVGGILPSTQLNCGPASSSSPHSPFADSEYATAFVLKDSAQTKEVVFKWSVTPKD